MNSLKSKGSWVKNKQLVKDSWDEYQEIYGGHPYACESAAPRRRRCRGSAHHCATISARTWADLLIQNLIQLTFIVFLKVG